MRGSLEHIDLLEVRLDEAIQAEVAVELEGAEDAPGIKAGGVLEHVTREVTVEALPTEIPERLVADVSAMEINDTLQLSAVPVPEGVKLDADDLEEVTIATLSPPRVEEEPEPELEEEAELVGEEGEGPARRARRRRGRAATRATPTGSSPCPLPPPPRGEGGGERILIVGLGNPGERYAGTRHNVGFEVGAELARRWGLPRAKKPFGGLIAEGRAGAGGPRVAILLPQTYMNESGDSAGPARGALKVAARAPGRHPRRDRPAVRRGPGPARRRARRPQRPQEPQARPRQPRVLARPGRRRAPRLERPRDRLRLRARPFPRAAGGGRRLIGRAAEEAERLVARLGSERDV